MVYFTLFHLDPTKRISFDQYLPIASNAHWCIVKWWLWHYTYSLTSKWSDRASLFTIPSNDSWKVLIQLERSTNTEQILSCCSLIKKDINFWREDIQPESSERGWKLWNNWWNAMWLNSAKIVKRSPWLRFAEWAVLNFTLKRRFICTAKGARRNLVQLFAILHFVEGDILSIGQVTRSAMYVLKYYCPKCEFCWQYDLDWGVKFAPKIVVNVCFNNKQEQAKACVHKDSWRALKPAME